jgi:hypothetical protein
LQERNNFLLGLIGNMAQICGIRPVTPALRAPSRARDYKNDMFDVLEIDSVHAETELIEGKELALVEREEKNQPRIDRGTMKSSGGNRGLRMSEYTPENESTIELYTRGGSPLGRGCEEAKETHALAVEAKVSEDAQRRGRFGEDKGVRAALGMLNFLLMPLAGLHFCVGLDFVSPSL